MVFLLFSLSPGRPAFLTRASLLCAAVTDPAGSVWRNGGRSHHCQGKKKKSHFWFVYINGATVFRLLQIKMNMRLGCRQIHDHKLGEKKKNHWQSTDRDTNSVFYLVDCFCYKLSDSLLIIKFLTEEEHLADTTSQKQPPGGHWLPSDTGTTCLEMEICC